jgi:FkbM family methyltransferase
MPRRPPTAEIAATILGARSTIVLDIGARWGAANARFRLDPLGKLVGFDPDPAECERLNRLVPPGGDERYVPLALGRTSGVARLYATVDPACSSLYPPDAQMADRYPELAVMRGVGSSEIRLATLDDWTNIEEVAEVSFIKLDIQGAELDVLQGAARILGQCLGLETEVEFSPLYLGQPLFADVDRYLRECGFALWRLDNLVHYSERPTRQLHRREVAYYDSMPVTREAGDGRLLWGHALLQGLPGRCLLG